MSSSRADVVGAVGWMAPGSVAILAHEDLPIGGVLLIPRDDNIAPNIIFVFRKRSSILITALSSSIFPL